MKITFDNLDVTKPKLVNELDRKFKAMGGPAMPIPKGPMPRGGRVPRR